MQVAEQVVAEDEIAFVNLGCARSLCWHRRLNLCDEVKQAGEGITSREVEAEESRGPGEKRAITTIQTPITAAADRKGMIRLDGWNKEFEAFWIEGVDGGPEAWKRAHEGREGWRAEGERTRREKREDGGQEQPTNCCHQSRHVFANQMISALAEFERLARFSPRSPAQRRSLWSSEPKKHNFAEEKENRSESNPKDYDVRNVA
ncbi:hypothetical protein DFH06DRAFT_1143713 [Mycena polygramma]|nr:hypothetical protein DFH06DRAFT_1143713 [Mycena polygramma]